VPSRASFAVAIRSSADPSVCAVGRLQTSSSTIVRHEMVVHEIKDAAGFAAAMKQAAGKLVVVGPSQILRSESGGGSNPALARR
jgi:hypothetical protein